MHDPARRLIDLDHAHVWHPFTPMRQWCESDPVIIESARGFELIDTDGRRYIDGVSSLWCNVHGHRVQQIDQAIRDQLDKVAHSTMLGLGNVPSIELAARLVGLTRAPHVHAELRASDPTQIRAEAPHEHAGPQLTKVFYSDAGATALEVAFKMAAGHWFHRGQPRKQRFIGMAGAYHGDTTGSMSVGFSELFHKPFGAMVFDVDWFDSPHPDPDAGLASLRGLLEAQADHTAAVVIEPVMQGAAGMIAQPPGFVRAVRELCDQHDVLLIADEVATGFGRTGRMFACEHDGVTPDALCLAKGLTGGYLPLAATLATDAIYDSFCGDLDDKRTLYHGHTYTGNPLGCAAALATLDLFEANDTLANVAANAKLIADQLNALRDHPHVLDIRQRGVMVGIELCRSRDRREPFDFSKRTGAAVCAACRARGLLIRPLGDVVVLMPAPAMDRATLGRMLEIVVATITGFDFG